MAQILFNPDGLGVVVGRKDVQNEYSDSTNFILLTNDQGQNWTDISHALNETAKKDSGRIEDSLTDVVFSKDKGIVVLTLRGKIYCTPDAGKSWNLISYILDEPPQTGISRFGILSDGRFWMFGSTYSIEGIWSMIAVMDDKSDWNRYRLSDYYFNDISFLSDNEVIACGKRIAENNLGAANKSDRAVVLYSEDSGKNWEIIYESKTPDDYYSVEQFSENRLLISSGSGSRLILNKI